MITVMRYGHRVGRDKRTTTHVGLVARAFGADEFILVGNDKSPIKTIKSVTKNWGGSFKCSLIKNWRKYLKDFKGLKLHLTMYGEPYKSVISKIKTNQNILIFVGAEKVPIDVYKTCDFNIAVISQPHSEIGALAVFLENLKIDTSKKFKDAKLKIEPEREGKSVIKL
ncbi:MAG: tRNA (cytidine(56)-2'-O)-methyltransferase [Candidatus Altiarchaeota archaeon]|nr:tRNA (cytidine(56)-2'-O)-methyltransferase [Candidatus Altiarchaeota archaeon]